MSEMIERAAKVLASYVRGAEREIASEALRAALDPEDEALQTALSEAYELGRMDFTVRRRKERDGKQWELVYYTGAGPIGQDTVITLGNYETEHHANCARDVEMRKSAARTALSALRNHALQGGTVE